MKKYTKTAFILSLFLTMTLIGQTILVTELSNAQPDRFQDNTSINPSESTIPGSPDVLAHEVSEYETYSEEDASYYYKTHEVNASDYCLTWLYRIYSLDQFDFYLYSDEFYTNQVDSATGYSYLNPMKCVIYRPTTAQKLYPVVNTTAIAPFSSGTARIETESADRINLSTEYSVNLYSTECGELYVVNLTASKSYTISLVMPSESDYDLYVFRMAPGATSSVDSHSSTRDTGENEKVKFRAGHSDDYAIVILWNSGTGNATLTVSISGGIPSFECIFVLVALISLISISLKKRKNILPI
jgi:hypothetical protein